MANLTTTYDCKIAALKHCGELSDGTSPFEDRMLDYLNRIYTELICGGSTFVPELAEAWPWARAPRPGLLTLMPTFDEALGGGVTLTNASITGVFLTAPSASLGSFVGRFLHIDSRPDVYRIHTHTAGSASFTLDQAYQSASVVGSGFDALKLDYKLLPDIVRLVEPFRVFAIQPREADGTGKIQGISPDELHRRYPLNEFSLLIGRTPTHFSVISESEANTIVRFNTVPFENARTEYEYVPLPADLSITVPATDPLPLVPPEHRSVLAYGAAYFLMVDKEDPRQDLYMRLTQSKIQAMLMSKDREIDDTTKDFARLSPRQDNLRRPWIRSTSGIRYI